MHQVNNLSAAQALEKLKEGNRMYVENEKSYPDVSLSKRRETALHGQQPYAVIISCSDSRVIPESIFHAGIGELFDIRVAGNVMDDHQLGSVEYAATHLGVKLIVVLGHDHCGACCLNVRRSMEIIESSLEIHKEEENGLRVAGAVYHLADGSVSFDI